MSDTPDMSENGNTQNLFDFDRSKGNFSFPERHKFDAGYGLTEATIDYICDVKDDPEWVRQFRKTRLPFLKASPCPPTGLLRILKNRLLPNPLLPLRRRTAQTKLGRRAGGCKAHLRTPGRSGTGTPVSGGRGSPVRLRIRLLQHEGGTPQPGRHLRQLHGRPETP